MKNEFGVLKEWTVNYIKNKDVLTKAIASIEEEKDGWDLVIKTKTGDKYCIIAPVIKDINQIIGKLNDNFVTLVVLNKKENLDIITENWSRLVCFPKLSVMFVNPNSELEKRWIIYPYTHDKITEKPSLKKGLKSLFQTVDPLR
ncbi:hypothetical protein JW707_04970 [Candidatus Woesearchaeota archaeon]|nr:hypothetical protein [Candidatus Woesearchaeota archaeon]